MWKLSDTGRKVPHSSRTGRNVDITKFGVGVSFDTAMAAYDKGKFDGVGFILGGGIVGIVIDDCIVDGKIHASALQLLSAVGCQYVELSPSGRGLHGLGLSTLTSTGKQGQIGGLKVEAYSTDRYLTVTGVLCKEFAGNGVITEIDRFEELVQLLSKRTPTQETQGTQVTQVTQVTQDAQATQDTQDTHVTQDSQETNARGAFATRNYADVPLHALPNGYGKRNASIFEFARYVMGRFPNTEADQHYKLVQQWFSINSANIKTKEFDATWIDFSYAWTTITTPYGQVLAEALANPVAVPDWMKRHRFGVRADKLLQVCCTLAQYHHPKPFFLSSRTAESILGYDYSDLAKLFRVLTVSGFLICTDKGDRHNAASYLLGKPV